MKVYTKTDHYGKFYYKDKEKTILHREDGPAIEWRDGDKSWYVNGKVHRMGGPADEAADSKSWWVNSEFIFEIDINGNIIDRME